MRLLLLSAVCIVQELSSTSGDCCFSFLVTVPLVHKTVCSRLETLHATWLKKTSCVHLIPHKKRISLVIISAQMVRSCLCLSGGLCLCSCHGAVSVNLELGSSCCDMILIPLRIATTAETGANKTLKTADVRAENGELKTLQGPATTVVTVILSRSVFETGMKVSEGD